MKLPPNTKHFICLLIQNTQKLSGHIKFFELWIVWIQQIVKLKDTVTRYENYLSNEQSQKLKAQAEKADLIRKSKSQFINSGTPTLWKKISKSLFDLFNLGIVSTNRLNRSGGKWKNVSICFCAPHRQGGVLAGGYGYVGV